MSQNGQKYSRWEVARILKVEKKHLYDGERGAVLKHIEDLHDGLDRAKVDWWVKAGCPTPSSQARTTGRMDYTLLMTHDTRP